MPDMSGEEISEKSMLMTILSSPLCPIPVSVMLLIMISIGVVIAFAIHALGSTELYDKNILDRGADAEWTFIGALLFSRMVLQLNFFPMVFKSQIMRGKSGNLRTNMSIYKAIDGSGTATGQAVVMDQTGATGQYNRANRSLSHFVETAPAVVVMLPLVASVFPFPAFVLTALYAMGRVLHQRGEAAGYGSHGPGFGISMVVCFVLEGLCAVSACKALGWSIKVGDAVLL
jgi:uncharacterized membrane protein YecN with MAPEG domain